MFFLVPESLVTYSTSLPILTLLVSSIENISMQLAEEDGTATPHTINCYSYNLACSIFLISMHLCANKKQMKTGQILS